MSDDPVPPPRQDNLYRPFAGEKGTHGPFDGRAKRYSWLFRVTTRPSQAVAALALAAAANLLAVQAWPRRRRQAQAAP